MALTKNHIVNLIYNHTRLRKKECTDVVESLLQIIKGTLANGEDVLISGFGKFCVKHKDKRKGRNPQTGKDLTLRSRRIVTFQCSGRLRDKINGGR